MPVPAFDDDQVLRDLARGAPLTRDMIQVVASWWHGGQASALYSLASTGAFAYPAEDYLREIEDTLREHPGGDEFRGECDGLQRLAGYVKQHVVSLESLTEDEYEAWASQPHRQLPERKWHRPQP